MQITKCFLLIKHNKDESLQCIYNYILHSQRLTSKIWTPATELEELEKNVEFEAKFAGQVDRNALGSIKGRYLKNLSLEQKQVRIKTKLYELIHCGWFR